jgi:ribonuclease P protein component
MVSSSVLALVVAGPCCVLAAPRDAIVSPSDDGLQVAGPAPHPAGFERCQRLLKPSEFAAVFSARRVLRGTCFALHHRENGGPSARLGLVIPKKQARSAVLRNAIKRQAREVYRLRQAKLPDFDLVLRLVRPVTSVDKPMWRSEIAMLLARLRPL